MKQLRNSIDNIRKAANSLGYANEEITNQTSESLNTSETNNDSLFGSEHKLLAIKPPVPTNMKPNPLTSNMFCKAASSHIQWDPQYSEKCIADFQHNVITLFHAFGGMVLHLISNLHPIPVIRLLPLISMIQLYSTLNSNSTTKRNTWNSTVLIITLKSQLVQVTMTTEFQPEGHTSVPVSHLADRKVANVVGVSTSYVRRTSSNMYSESMN